MIKTQEPDWSLLLIERDQAALPWVETGKRESRCTAGESNAR